MLTDSVILEMNVKLVIVNETPCILLSVSAHDASEDYYFGVALTDKF